MRIKVTPKGGSSQSGDFQGTLPTDGHKVETLSPGGSRRVSEAFETPLNIHTSPELEASFLSRLFFSWISPTVAEGYKRELTFEDMFALRTKDQSTTCKAGFEKYLYEDDEGDHESDDGSDCHRKAGQGGEQEEKTPSSTHTFSRIPTRTVRYALLRMTRWAMFVAGICIFLGDLMGYAGPILLNMMIRFTEDEESAPVLGEWFGYAAVAALFLAAVLQAVFLHKHHLIVTREAMHIRAATVATIFSKTLCLSSHSRDTLTQGKITNMMSTDSQRLMDLWLYMHYIWSTPLQIVVTLSLLYFFLGKTAFVAAFLTALFIPLQMGLASRHSRLSKEASAATDHRVDVLNEIVQGIRAIKYFAWEKLFVERANEARRTEMHWIKMSAYTRALNVIVLESNPIIVALVCVLICRCLYCLHFLYMYV